MIINHRVKKKRRRRPSSPRKTKRKREKELERERETEGETRFEVALPVCRPTPAILRPVTRYYYVHMPMYHGLPDRSDSYLYRAARCGYTRYSPLVCVCPHDKINELVSLSPSPSLSQSHLSLLSPDRPAPSSSSSSSSIATDAHQSS